jgi:hypothetical protein
MCKTPALVKWAKQLKSEWPAKDQVKTQRYFGKMIVA